MNTLRFKRETDYADVSFVSIRKIDGKERAVISSISLCRLLQISHDAVKETLKQMDIDQRTYCSNFIRGAYISSFGGPMEVYYLTEVGFAIFFGIQDRHDWIEVCGVIFEQFAEAERFLAGARGTTARNIEVDILQQPLSSQGSDMARDEEEPQGIIADNIQPFPVELPKVALVESDKPAIPPQYEYGIRDIANILNVRQGSVSGWLRKKGYLVPNGNGRIMPTIDQDKYRVFSIGASRSRIKFSRAGVERLVDEMIGDGLCSAA